MAPTVAASSCPQSELDIKGVLMFAVCWEVMYQIAKLITRSSKHEKIQKFGHSYVTAFSNAVVCSIGGTWAAYHLYVGDHVGRAVVTQAAAPFWPGGPSGPVGVIVYETFAYCFLGWLCFDVFHIFTHYPKLGGADTVAHHCGFICLTCLGTMYKVLPFPVAWLLVGEISSLPLNIRWFLINTGRGQSSLLQVMNIVFAVSFFIVRVLIYWSGVYNLLMHLRPTLIEPPYACAPWVVNTLCFFISAGALLNAHWMVAILKMATRGGAKHTEHYAKDDDKKKL